MRKIALLVAAAGFGLSGAASAADLAPMYKKAPIAPMWSWTGSYIGLFVGGADGRNVSTTLPTTTAVLPTTVAATSSYDLGSSFIGGYTSGYNWQFSPNWLIGYEGETGYINVKASTIFPAPNGNVNATASVGNLYTVWSARFGYVADKSLLYVKGGALLTRVESSINQVAPPVPGANDRKYALGYAVGGGWEYAFDPKWSVKAEYLYLGLDKDLTFASTATTNVTTHFSGIHTGKVGLNYKWDWFSLLR